MKPRAMPRVGRLSLLPFMILVVCQVPPPAAQGTDLDGLLRPSAKQKIRQATRELAARMFSSPGSVDIYSAGVSVVKGHFQNVSGQDLDATLYLVLLSLYESLQQDLEQQVTDVQKSNRVKRERLSYKDALNAQLTLLRNNRKGTPPSSRAPAAAAAIARPIRSSPELTQTRLLGIKYAKVPPLPPQPDPRQLSVSELEEGIRAADAAVSLLDEVLRVNQRTLDDASQKRQQVAETRDRLMKATGDRLKSVAQSLR